MKKPVNVALWGLDVAEISSLIYTLEIGQYTKHEVSIYPFVKEIKIGTVTFNATVPSANEGARRSFRDDLTKFDAIVYLVNPTDAESFIRTKEELDSLLIDQAISGPILVLVQKPYATEITNEEILQQESYLEEAVAKSNGRIAQFAYSLSSSQVEGYEEGFRWLLENL